MDALWDGDGGAGALAGAAGGEAARTARREFRRDRRRHSRCLTAGHRRHTIRDLPSVLTASVMFNRLTTKFIYIYSGFLQVL